MIRTTFQIHQRGIDPAYKKPWNQGEYKSSLGSGFGVEVGKKKYVLTNAHVINTEKSSIKVVKWSSSKKYDAKIINIAPSVDMALLEMSNEFWGDIPILPLKTSPKKGEEIIVVGFPNGGHNASITRGIVSRLAPMPYSNSVKNMTIQIDAAVNPGNSGGPVIDIEGEHIVGIAFMHTSDAQNMCNMIPEFTIQHYLKEFEKTGKFNGVCDLGIKYTNLDNKTQQKVFLGKDEHGLKSGALVCASSNLSIKVGDVLHSIDGTKIQNDGTISMSNTYEILDETHMEEKVPYWHILRTKNPGDKIGLVIYRKGISQSLNIRLYTGPNWLVPRTHNHISLDYYEINGFVFQALNHYHIGPSKNWRLLQHKDSFKDFDDHEIVILVDVKPTESTEGFPKTPDMILMSIDGVKVKNLAHVRELTKKGIVMLIFEQDIMFAINSNA